MEFSRYEYWSGLPLPTPEDLSDPGTKPRSLALTGVVFTTEHLESPQLFKKQQYSYFPQISFVKVNFSLSPTWNHLLLEGGLF